MAYVAARVHEIDIERLNDWALGLPLFLRTPLSSCQMCGLESRPAGLWAPRCFVVDGPASRCFVVDGPTSRYFVLGGPTARRPARPRHSCSVVG